MGRTPASLARLRGKQGLYIYTCAAANAEQEQSDTILGKLNQATLALESLPQCGNVPPELEIMDITRYREIYAQPWRIIFKALEAVVNVRWLFDSRQNVGLAACAKRAAG